MSVSKTILIGNVGGDPDIRNLPNGSTVANFSLATSEKWKDKDGNKQEKTSWHRLAVFGKLADVVSQYVKKGDKLYIEGRLDYQEYNDKTTGEKKYSTQIVVNQLQMLGSKSGKSQSNAQPAGNSQQGAAPSAEFDGDIPFSPVRGLV